jgi:NADH-quinone oxidoreductase subunit K
MIELAHFQVVSAALFSIGVYGLLAHKMALRKLLSIGLMFNAAGLNLIGFAAFLDMGEPQRILGQVIIVCMIVVSAAQLMLVTAVILRRYVSRSSASVVGAGPADPQTR